jgi:hypothetical protein
MRKKSPWSLRRNFIIQQGYPEPTEANCDVQYSALRFQPKLVGAATIIGVVSQSPAFFLALAAVLWWSALSPRWNPFEALYHELHAGRSGRSLGPAPAPRRFAQGMAATFALAIGLSLQFGWRTTAFTLEALFVVAIAALVFGGFCLGSFVYHLLTGRGRFAVRTVPWARCA